MITQEKLARVFAKTRATLRDTVFSVDTDALVFIDAEGMDTAWMGGADYHIEKLTDEQVNQLNIEGYLIDGENIYAFSRYLMETWLQQTVALQAHKEAWAELLESTKDIVETSEVRYQLALESDK